MSKIFLYPIVAMNFLLINQGLMAQVISIEIDTVAQHTGMVGSADLTGMTTYRIYAAMSDTNQRLIGYYGDPEHPMVIGSTGGLYNFQQLTQLNPPGQAMLNGIEETHFDSWLTLKNDVNLSSVFIISSSSDLASTFTTTTSSETILTLAPEFGFMAFGSTPTTPDQDNRILLFQLTTDGSPIYQLHFYVADGPGCGSLFYSQSFDNLNGLYGCSDPQACNYSPSVLYDLPEYCSIAGCLDPLACNYNIFASCNDNGCVYPFQCQDPLACNYLIDECMITECAYDQATIVFHRDNDGDGVLTSVDSEYHMTGQVFVPSLNETFFVNSGAALQLPSAVTYPAEIVLITDANTQVLSEDTLLIQTGCITENVLVDYVYNGCSLYCSNGLFCWDNTLNLRFQLYSSYSALSHNATCSLVIDSPLSFFDETAQITIESYPYTFSWDNYNNSISHRFSAIDLDASAMGSLCTYELVCDITDQSDNVVCTTSEFNQFVIACSYDPNYKAATPAGWYEPNFVQAGQSIEYEIHFQNTGNAPAIDVVVLDTLDLATFDLDSFEFGISSHPVAMSLNHTTGVLTANFININLPDSANFPEESQGYFTYRITPYADLAHMSPVLNRAAIYFDANDPIYTPYVSQTTFDCQTLIRQPIQLEYCHGTPISLDVFQQYVEPVTWWLNEELIYTGDSLYLEDLQPGLHEIQYRFQNPDCDVTNVIEIAVSDTIELNYDYEQFWFFTNAVNAIHEWYIDGELVTDNSSNILPYTGQVMHLIIEVVVTDENGCESSAIQILIGQNENEMAQFRIFPNPVSNELILEGNLKGINPSELQIVNAKGELVEVKTERKGNNQFIINMVSLPPGIYAVMVAGHRLNCTPIVKH